MARDTLRDRKKERFWRRMVRRQIDSGLSIRGWCRQRSLSEALFHWWRRELSRRDAERPTPGFLPVHVAGAVSMHTDDQIEIVLADERRVRVRGRVDRQVLADVLSVLTSASSVESEGRAC